MRIKIDPLDKLFSQYIRLRDGGVCQRCGGKGNQTSHFYSRAKRSLRWDDSNACLLCFGCHHYFHAYPLEHVEFWKHRLGEEAFTNLQARANTPQKPDRELIKILLKKLVEEIE